MPAVDAEKIKQDGMLAAMHHGVKGKAAIGSYHGKFGVIFQRVR